MLDGDGLAKVLKSIDDEVALELGIPARRYQVIVVGGAAFVLSGLTRRPATHDIDVLEADFGIEGILARYGMVNSAVAAHVDSLPYNFEDRLSELPVRGRAVEFLAPSLEDLAVMKLYAWRPNDEADLTSPGTLAAMNWERLDRLVNDPAEAAASALSERAYHEMKWTYERYRRRWHDGEEADL